MTFGRLIASFVGLLTAFSGENIPRLQAVKMDGGLGFMMPVSPFPEMLFGLIGRPVEQY